MFLAVVVAASFAAFCAGSAVRCDLRFRPYGDGHGRMYGSHDDHMHSRVAEYGRGYRRPSPLVPVKIRERTVYMTRGCGYAPCDAPRICRRFGLTVADAGVKTRDLFLNHLVESGFTGGFLVYRDDCGRRFSLLTSTGRLVPPSDCDRGAVFCHKGRLNARYGPVVRGAYRRRPRVYAMPERCDRDAAPKSIGECAKPKPPVVGDNHSEMSGDKCRRPRVCVKPTPPAVCHDRSEMSGDKCKRPMEVTVVPCRFRDVVVVGDHRRYLRPDGRFSPSTEQRLCALARNARIRRRAYCPPRDDLYAPRREYRRAVAGNALRRHYQRHYGPVMRPGACRYDISSHSHSHSSCSSSYSHSSYSHCDSSSHHHHHHHY